MNCPNCGSRLNFPRRRFRDVLVGFVCAIIAGLIAYNIPKPPAFGTPERVRWEVYKSNQSATVLAYDDVIVIEYVPTYPTLTDCRDLRSSRWFEVEIFRIEKIMRAVDKSGFDFNEMYVSAMRNFSGKWNDDALFIGVQTMGRKLLQDEQFMASISERAILASGTLHYCCCEFGEGKNDGWTCGFPIDFECDER